MDIPRIEDSTKEERVVFIAERYKCMSNCDMCGICKSLHGDTPEIAFEDYIEGRREFSEIASEYSKREKNRYI